MEIFNQAVWIALVGMGLTFAAIGLLVVAMVALTRWASGPVKAAAGKKESGGSIPSDEEFREAEQAAAVAVAIALAEAARRVHPIHAWHATRPEEDVNPWQAYVRGQQLDQGKTHQTLRW
jgi:Na+-transporting methylmalonyl-CoA/oxaloacetate decarboxylase gamma subunit